MNCINLQNYKYSLDNHLSYICLPVHVLECTDMLCTDDHKHDLELFHNKIVDSCINSAELSIPLNSSARASKSNVIPGWDEELTIFRNKSQFWHMLWKAMGKPTVGIVFNIMRSTRLVYHYKLRKLKRNRKRIVQNRLGEAISSCKTIDFWKEVKKIKGSNRTISRVIDEADNKLINK